MSSKSQMKVFWAEVTSDLGTSHLALTEKGLCRHSLPGELPEKFFSWLDKRFESENIVEDPDRLLAFQKILAGYVDGKAQQLEADLDVIGTEFQKQVWTEIQKVNYGEMVSYKVIATKIGLKGGAQAVGTAVGQNPLHLFIPCHRIIGSKGDLRGFAAGTIMKKWLLTHEGALLL